MGLAAGAGQLKVVRQLIEEGADLHLAKTMGPQPLHRAAATGIDSCQTQYKVMHRAAYRRGAQMDGSHQRANLWQMCTMLVSSAFACVVAQTKFDADELRPCLHCAIQFLHPKIKGAYRDNRSER